MQFRKVHASFKEIRNTVQKKPEDFSSVDSDYWGGCFLINQHSLESVQGAEIK